MKTALELLGRAYSAQLDAGDILVTFVYAGKIVYGSGRPREGQLVDIQLETDIALWKDGPAEHMSHRMVFTPPSSLKENVDWIRGRYDENSPEAQALLAAWALTD